MQYSYFYILLMGLDSGLNPDRSRVGSGFPPLLYARFHFPVGNQEICILTNRHGCQRRRILKRFHGKSYGPRRETPDLHHRLHRRYCSLLLRWCFFFDCEFSFVLLLLLMICVFAAMQKEAQPLIERLRLVKDVNSPWVLFFISKCDSFEKKIWKLYF